VFLYFHTAIMQLSTFFIDPPRTGLPGKAIRQLRSISRIDRLVYVASDPRAAMKNLVDLTRPTSATFSGDPFMPVR
jgi:tRNA (uracil-5-)-methyltransferase